MTPSQLSISPPDSERFGLKILRGRVERVEPKALALEILAAACDVAIVRAPADRSANIHQLSRWALPVIHADTLVYYKCDLEKYQPLPLRNADLTLRLAQPDDRQALGKMIAATFHDYISHYHANPLLSPDLIIAGYQQWAESHVDGAGKILWVAERAGQLVAFAACSHDPSRHEAEGVLYGVAPDQSGGGLYGDLIRHTQAMFKARGVATMKVSTQVTNYAVQKVWAREGFHLYEALDTFHVNALLDAGPVVHDREVTFPPAQIARFAEACGDRNPIHLDDAAAKTAGFPARIAHGVLAAAEISRILGMETPGAGTVLGHLDMAFLHPLVADARYRASLRIPGGVKAAGPMHAVATIHDLDGSLCCLAHADIFLKR